MVRIDSTFELNSFDDLKIVNFTNFSLCSKQFLLCFSRFLLLARPSYKLTSLFKNLFLIRVAGRFHGKVDMRV